MPHVLHLIKDPDDRTALDVIASQARDPSVRLTVVLMQRAAHLEARLGGEVYRLDQTEGGGAAPSPHPSIDHAGLLDLIFAADTVVTW